MVDGERRDRDAAAAVQLVGVTKIFGEGDHALRALDDVTLEIEDNEFFTLLGPSGCGKTTLLRGIAGFEQLTRGRILLFGEEIDALAPNHRPVNTVFQQYALFPHMTVGANVAFGLRMLGRPADEIRRIVGEMLELVKMGHLAERKPAQLSGGQQQRVALARALASQPKVLLLDEPLSALDLKLRQEMRVELKQLQQDTGITFIFVTHDQEEALTMSDRIAVMNEGRVQQVGTAHEVYEHPANHFVADFIGMTNFLEVTVSAVEHGHARCRTAAGATVVADALPECRPGMRALLSVRPEKISLAPAADGARGMVGTIRRLIYLGTDTHYQVALADDTELLVRVQNAHTSTAFEAGLRVALDFDAGAVRMLVE